MTLMKEAGLLVFEWIAGRVLLGGTFVICRSVRVIGKKNAGVIAGGWLSRFESVFGDDVRARG
jgi:hypothetical protein